jgi:phospholipid:diacylglycerol acyltransferase
MHACMHTCMHAGELRETANLEGVASIIGEQLLGKEERTLVWRTWGSAMGMLPAGGNAIWGNTSWAPDDFMRNNTKAGTCISNG